MGNNTIIRFLFVITLIIGTFNLGYGKDEHPLLKETEHKFDRLGLDLKGDVFSVVTKKVKHRQEFGQDKIIGKITTDSIVFDQNGRIVSRYYNPEIGDDGRGKYLRNREKYIYSGNDVLKINGEIRQYIEIVDTDKDSIRYKREFDNQGRLIQETAYINEKPTTQIKFQYIPGGYEVKYYRSLQSDATTYTLKNGVVKITATSVGGKKYPFDTYFFNKNEKLVRNIKYPRLVLGTSPYATEYYSYNAYGDVVKEELVWSSGGRKDIKTYSYEYDKRGNWISKMSKNGNEIEWLRRVIIYKNPDEIIHFFKEKADREKALHDSIVASAKEKLLDKTNQLKTLAKQYIEEQIGQDLGYRLNHNYLYHNKFPIEVKQLNYSNGLYDFKLDNDDCLKNVKFTKSPDLLEGYLSSDMKLGLFLGKVNTRREFVTTWLVASISSNYDDICQNIESWAENIRSDESLLCNENAWDYENKSYGLRSEISATLGELNYIPFDIASTMNYPEGMDKTAADNVRKEILAHIEQIAQEEAKRLCTFAYHAIEQCNLMQEYDKLSKFPKGTVALGAFLNRGSIKSNDYTIPDIIKLGQIAKFEVKGDLYSFIKKDKSVIQDVHFNRMVSDLDYSYHDYGFLSDDKRYALIIYHNSDTKDFIYLVEIEGNEVKSINSIPYKKSKDFVMPQI